MVGSGDEYETCYETPTGASPIPPPRIRRNRFFCASKLVCLMEKSGVTFSQVHVRRVGGDWNDWRK
jgi:hypothetical protein